MDGYLSPQWVAGLNEKLARRDRLSSSADQAAPSTDQAAPSTDQAAPSAAAVPPRAAQAGSGPEIGRVCQVVTGIPSEVREGLGAPAEATRAVVAFTASPSGAWVEVEWADQDAAPPEADVTMVIPYDVALALAQGRLSAAQVIHAGTVQVRGNLALLACLPGGLGAGPAAPGRTL